MFLQNLNSKAKKNLKFINWLRWIERLLARRGILTDTDSCAYGKTHLVSKAEKVGGGWMFYSQGCSGCAISRMGLEVKGTGKPLPRGAPNCALLSGPLFSMTEVKNGKQIYLPFIIVEEKEKPVYLKKIVPASIPGLRSRKPRPRGSNLLSHAYGTGGGSGGGGQIKIGNYAFNPNDMVNLEIDGVNHQYPAHVVQGLLHQTAQELQAIQNPPLEPEEM